MKARDATPDIRDLPRERDIIRERRAADGLTALSGCRRDVAVMTLRALGGIASTLMSDETVLAQHMTVRQAERVAAAGALARMYREHHEGTRYSIGYAQQMYELLRADCLHLREQELFYVASINVHNILIGLDEIGRGTATGVEVQPRDVFRVALRRNAVGIVISHNHPSGIVQPSPEDLELTRRLIAASTIIGVPIVDHVIVGSSGYHSMREHGEVFDDS